MPPTASGDWQFYHNMKLLFDQNLSWRLPQKLADLYTDSQHIREAGLKEAQDIDIW